ncbi:hypothetical protein NQ314_019782, partial [Rhamnusium bicolor]
MISQSSDPANECELNVRTQWKNLSIYDEQKKSNQNENSVSFIDNKALRMMHKMGYKSGSGLGKNEQGITKAIDVTCHLGKRGLGLNIKGVEATNAAWDFSKEIYHKNNVGPYYFADVCAGPGGFTEYILWRKGWGFKGFGLTLKDENDFALHESTCASSVTFQSFYGKLEDGNVCCPENIEDFKEKVIHETDVSILKPNSSRPANSERYFICSNLKKGSVFNKIKEYMWTIVRRLWQIKDNSEIDVLEIVPMEIIKKDEQFYSYIIESNNSLGKRQIIGLQKLAAFCRNASLIDARQEELRRQCLKFWQIPDNARILMFLEILLVQPREVNNMENFYLTFGDIADWHYCPMYCSKKSNNCNFYA